MSQIEPRSVLDQVLDQTPPSREDAIRAKEWAERAKGTLARWRNTFPLRHVLAAQRLGGLETPLPDDFQKIAVACQTPLDEGGIVALCGGRGRGKTLLATYLAMCGASRGVEARYWRLADLFGAFRHRCYGPAHESEMDVLSAWGKEALLVIDEVQDVTTTEFTANLLTRLIDHRYANMVPTVLISNMLPNELREYVGKSVSSRFDEDGTVIVMNEKNYRVEGKNHERG